MGRFGLKPKNYFMRHAADLYAKANKSDPFAHARIMNEMRRSIATPNDVIEDAKRILAARGYNVEKL